MKVFAFDRDETVDVNPPKGRRAVPLSWVRHLAHETHHEVWAIGNQQLRDEAGIPGIEEALREFPGETTAGLTREKRIRMVGQLFPDADAYYVVDDLNLNHLDGWTHYFPWDFVTAVEEGHLRIPLPEVES